MPAPDWNHWLRTHKVLIETYYKDGFPEADQLYALAGLTRYAALWDETHRHRDIPHWIIDQAAAHEVLYHHYRGRLFRRPCAALSACWTAIVCERPERIIDRHARHLAKLDKEQKKKVALTV